MKRIMQLAEVQTLKEPIEATVRVPGSKSYSLRALLISALCKDKFKIDNLLDSQDTRAMQDCIINLQQGRELNAKDSGLTARFMLALSCISPGVQVINGSAGLKKRPLDELVDGLRYLGAQIEYLEQDGFLPLKVVSSQLSGGTVKLTGSISSQYLSALLLIAPRLKNGLVIDIKGRQISRPYIDMTIDIMSHFGIEVENLNYQKYLIKPSEYKAKDYRVEGDYSAAGYFFAAGHLTGSKIKIEGLNSNSKQGDKKLTDLLKPNKVLPAVINVSDFPDQAMTLAVLAAFRKGKTIINGVASLRIKETERVIALQNELAKMGITTHSTKDSLTIYGGHPRAATIDTYGDHRIAMSFALAGLKVPHLKIMSPHVVDKTFPDFWGELAKVTLVQFKDKTISNILLIGMRGSGKSTIGKRLAKQLGMDFVDMDKYIEEKHQKKVRDIVVDHGWEYFRDLESSACNELSKRQNCIISSGGGVVLRKVNMQKLSFNSAVILLQANPNLLSRRIKNDENRPELSTQPTLIGELGQVWKERKSLYFKYAEVVINANVSPKKVVDEIIQKLGIK